MGMRTCLAAVVMLLTSRAFAEHAISPEPGPEVAQAASLAPAQIVVVQSAQAGQSARTMKNPPSVNVTVPSGYDVYLVAAATREVCDTVTFGGRDVRTQCRTEPLAARAPRTRRCEGSALRAMGAEPAIEHLCLRKSTLRPTVQLTFDR